MSITVKDVAKKAGVATSTVSRVVNDHPSISEDTKKKVQSNGRNGLCPQSCGSKSRQTDI